MLLNLQRLQETLRFVTVAAAADECLEGLELIAVFFLRIFFVWLINQY